MSSEENHEFDSNNLDLASLMDGDGGLATEVVGKGGYDEGVVKSLLSFTPTLQAVTVESLGVETTMFRERTIVPQPPFFEADRKDIRYIPSSDPTVGERVVINDKEFKVSGRGYGNLLYYLDVKGGSKYFLTSFDEKTRGKMTTELIERRSNRMFKIFYTNDSTSGPTILNLVPSEKPVISDLTLLQLLEKKLGTEEFEGVVKGFKQTESGLLIDILTNKGFEVPNDNPTVGDVMKYGARISSSQLGWKPTSVDKYVWRLICLNGAMGMDTMSIWGTKGRDESMSEEDIFRWVNGSLDAVFADLGYVSEKAKEAATTKADPMLFVNLATQEKLSKAILIAIERGYNMEPGSSVWHAHNAITRAARDGGFDLPTQVRLERLGGGLVYV